MGRPVGHCQAGISVLIFRETAAHIKMKIDIQRFVGGFVLLVARVHLFRPVWALD